MNKITYFRTWKDVNSCMTQTTAINTTNPMQSQRRNQLSATKRTTTNASMKQPAAILVVRRFVDASMKIIPQNDEPRSAIQNKTAASLKGLKVD
jgi:hypothetical protein